MTLHRRRRPHTPAPQDRLRALGPAASPAVQRLHARIPRPSEAGPGTGPPPIPRAPYALDTADAPYGPPVDAADEAALDTTVQRTRLVPPVEADPDAVPTERLRPARGRSHAEPRAVRPGPTGAGGHRPARVWRGPSPAREQEAPRDRPLRPTRASPGPHARPADPVIGPAHGTQHGHGARPGAEAPPGPEYRAGAPGSADAGREGSTRAQRRAREGGPPRARGVGPGLGGGEGRPPSGYTEFDPAESLLERWTRRWTAQAALSRRAVLALTVLGFLAVGATLMALRDRPQTVEPNTAVQAAAGPAPRTSAAPGGDVVVHVSGDVADPGLYTLAPGARVSDAVDAAGGPLPDTDLDRLNLARPLTDGEQIVVGPPDPEGTAAGTAGGSLVNVNRADAATLETLPGIGEVIAANIIAHREEHGPFVQVEDLVDVSKIGDAVLADIAPLVTVG
ncbi:helix-hairpin-helix domain-containing protein [Nocardiopsis sp. YSL2]|uniref:helix-hairpin-helix domain-containing protein n=1 Tax=Nocardiopsis sp. YSL2 TaxID=2939492 RepID=UPI0026F43630|nr:helix-hairpin-helix domain-containing protein [Nocardiopsis sp. YSL2]